MGRVFKSTNTVTDEFRDLYSFSTDAITSYQLGSFQAKNVFEPKFPTIRSVREDVLKAHSIILDQSKKIADLMQAVETLQQKLQPIDPMHNRVEQVEAIAIKLDENLKGLQTELKDVMKIQRQHATSIRDMRALQTSIKTEQAAQYNAPATTTTTTMISPSSHHNQHVPAPINTQQTPSPSQSKKKTPVKLSPATTINNNNNKRALEESESSDDLRAAKRRKSNDATPIPSNGKKAK